MKKMNKSVWDKNKDYSPGDSFSDNSEKLLKRGRGTVSVIDDCSEAGVCAVRHTCW